MKNIQWILFVFLLVFVAGCGKKSETTPSKTELISKNWKMQKVSGETGGASIVIYERGKTGNMENFDSFSLYFVNNGTFTGKDETGEMLAGTWKFSENDTKLTIKWPGDDSEVVFSVQNLSSNNMDLFITQKDEETGKDVKITYFFTPM
jgi:hypothetical protein